MERSRQFDLGLDRTRIKDQRDARRQSATVDALLSRLFCTRDDRRWELQVLADEVGMGKTFVGLGVAYSLLESMRSDSCPADLRGCYQKILIITPNNSSLFAKWQREVGEFVKRCIHKDFRDDANRWFAPMPVERLDDLVCELRKGGRGPRVIIASMGIFDRGKLQNYDVKRRHLLGVLFRYWSNKFQHDLRSNLLKGAPENWLGDPRLFDAFDDRELTQILFSNDELTAAISQVDQVNNCVDDLLTTCTEIAQPYVRGRAELFVKVTNQLTRIYRELMPFLIGQALPLVIVDEAHHWKNGPTNGSNGYKDFAGLLGGRIRRALLLTATPFQLRPAEMLEILKVGDLLQPCPTQVESDARRNRLRDHRENTIAQILDRAARHGRGFAKAWSKLPSVVSTKTVDAAWGAPAISTARDRLDEIARRSGVVTTHELEQVVEEAVSEIAPDIRQLIREGLRLFVYNSELSHELGSLVVRHRRQTGHRHFRVGVEYQRLSNGSMNRTDRHVLHAAPGVNVQGDGELPHYLLMRCVSEMKGGKGRSSLGTALTGCYSTLIDSAEGRGVRTRLENSPIGKVYLELLMEMVNAKHDPKHPKVREVVEAVVANWMLGEKTLIFCFRTNTAKRLHEIIDERIRMELSRQRERCMGGPESLKALRTRLTGKDRDLVVLGMDRVLWSVLWCNELNKLASRPLVPDDLELRDVELNEVAALGLRYGVDLLSERVDRVFLHRATESVIARRLMQDVRPCGMLKDLLSDIASDNWICGPYGLSSTDSDDDSGAEIAHFDERGIHSVYVVAGEISEVEVAAIAKELLERRLRARKQGQTAVFDVYERGPNLWLGTTPKLHWEQHNTIQTSQVSPTLHLLHENALALTVIDGVLDWESRRATFQAIRRAVLRESVLLRLLPSEKERDDSGWGELLVEKFLDPLPKQRESTADHIAAFLEDMVAASGKISDPKSARFALYDATRLRDQQFVALVSGVHGSKDKQTRERVFSGFNTPLLPEVLICTSVGQEGIDLHRHCRHVVHFDLAWNPAVMEQRTGRTDRIGSKTFRERAHDQEASNSFLEIGVPYLAGTYDERMYEELRLRAQTFEVLTGGDLTADEAEGLDNHSEAEGEEAGLRFVPLPDSMVEAMRVSLHVWSDPSSPRNFGAAIGEAQQSKVDSGVTGSGLEASLHSHDSNRSA